jgi:ATP-dependent Lon protease
MADKLEKFPILPLRDIVMFPGMIAPLFIGRDKSIKALEYVVEKESDILFSTQKDASVEDPKEGDIYSIGVLAAVLQLLKLPDGTVKVLVEGKKRVKIEKIIDDKEFLEAEVIELGDDDKGSDVENEALNRSIIAQFEQYAKLNKKTNPDVVKVVATQTESSILADIVATNLSVKLSQKQKILEIINVTERLRFILGLIEAEISIVNTQKQINSMIKDQIHETEKKYYLNEQMKAIQRVLGDGEDGSKSDIAEFEDLLKNPKLPLEVQTKAKAELRKLKQMSPMSAEATVVRHYLDWLLKLPWGQYNKLKLDIARVEQILNNDHYGLETVKERILEYVAVQQKTKKLAGPILCLVGPPGVGKTSLARSIAEATGREFVKFSLGGVRDEAEVRGHRRTYIGAMPGRIIQCLKKAKTSNPVFLLDEIDKMGSDYRGDPAAALLEVLDPEQNKQFNDHYLEIDYDLSKVMFIATANSFDIPHALLDRLEIIRLSGYVEEEKIEIAKRHLIPKQREAHGLKEKEWTIDNDVIRDSIRYYTREAGVRSLEREIAKLARKTVRHLVDKKSKSVAITQENLSDFLGVRKYNFGMTEKENMVGLVNGLAYTESGGDLLTIEAVQLPGKGSIKTTGKIGDVMQESAQAAFSFFKSRSYDFGIKSSDYQQKNIHIHVPEGAVPKDGPSAGIAIFVTIVSIMTGIPVKKDVAMTGEITLRGRVLAIGGLKEKLLAANRGGVKIVLIPQENEKDLTEIPDTIKKSLTIIPVFSALEALKIALVEEPKMIEWSEIEQIAQIPPEKDSKEFVTH